MAPRKPKPRESVLEYIRRTDTTHYYHLLFNKRINALASEVVSLMDINGMSTYTMYKRAYKLMMELSTARYVVGKSSMFTLRALNALKVIDAAYQLVFGIITISVFNDYANAYFLEDVKYWDRGEYSRAVKYNRLLPA